MWPKGKRLTPNVGAWCRLPDGSKRTVRRVDTIHGLRLNKRPRRYVGFRLRPSDGDGNNGAFAKRSIGCCVGTRSSEILWWVRSDKVTVIR